MLDVSPLHPSPLTLHPSPSTLHPSHLAPGAIHLSDPQTYAQPPDASTPGQLHHSILAPLVHSSILYTDAKSLINAAHDPTVHLQYSVYALDRQDHGMIDATHNSTQQLRGSLLL